MELLEGLNKEQKKAVVHGEGPLLVLAGAGTGKTKVITHRIAYLIASKGAKPDEILAVTFTEKAASEMEERVDLLVPYGYSYVDISTFNSFGEKVLRNTIHEIGYYPDFKLLDDVEQAIFFSEHLFDFPLKYYRPLSLPRKHVQELIAAIKRLKQEDIDPEDYLNYAIKLEKQAKDAVELEQAQKHLEMAQVYREYQRLLVKEGKIDFEDQVVLTVKLFKERPSVLKEYQQRYKYILVDEFQDTNSIQFELLKLLCENHQNLTVVGDDDQSIFRFRGASLSNIRSFRQIYPGTRKVVLVKNYRSTQDILDSSYRLIQHNNPDRLEVQEQVSKRLESAITHSGKSIRMIQLDSLSHEADKVAEIILEKTKEGYSFKDLAILVRRNADADPFLRALNMKEIPFRFSGSRGLYAQEEVKILVSFIRAMTDFEDSKSLFHLALSDAYGIDTYDLTKLSNFAAKKHIALHRVFQLVSRGESPVEIAAPSGALIKTIFSDLLFFSQLASAQNAGRVLYSFLERSGFLKKLIEKRNLASEIKIKNIRIFFDKVKNFSELGEDDSLFGFAKHLDLLQQVGDNPAAAEAEMEEDAVNVLTVHKAKGLEFPVVFMVSLIADRFPGRQRREKIPVPDELLEEELPERENYLQEERRLFYVGMTRTKTLLYLIWSKDYGLKRPKKVSPFVLEALDIPEAPKETLHASALEEIRRYAPSVSPKIPQTKVKEQGSLTLSFFQVNDYLTCPLKYKYRHIMRIPVLPHHNLTYGRILHNMIHFYLSQKMTGKRFGEEELIREYAMHWINEGFLSREHEEMRKKEGERILRLFYNRQESSGILPLFLEKEFRWQHESIRFIGRWDRIDPLDKGAVIIDYKATSVKDQKEADKRARDSLQMDLYALSFKKTQDLPLCETQLYFLESDIIGHAEKGEKEQHRAMAKIEEAKAGIIREKYKAEPDWHNCNFCEFKTICPDSYAY
ncbi:MAG: ATP-dependent DNA helicase [Candidatus Aminicenantes bacterium]|jgi:DNA helicase-2/ATP-dependent DNA helicase PcrA